MTAAIEREVKPFDQWLDLFRWLAAYVVLYTHTTNRYLLPVSEVHGHRSLAHFAASFLSGFSHQAVMVFFVLSGYLVGGGLVREYRRSGTIDARTYLVKRFARLWTVLIPAMLLGLGANLIAVHAFPQTAAVVLPKNLPEQQSLATFACTVAFLHTAACSPFAGDGPLWSLFNEFWYYVTWLLIFPLLFMRGALPPRIGAAVAGIVVLTVLTIAQFTGSPIGPYMLIWLVGVAAAIIPRAPVRSPIVAAALLIGFLLAVRFGVRREFWESSPAGTFGFDLALGALFALLIAALRDRVGLRSPPAGHLHFHLAEFSFSLYCIHAPLLNLYTVAMLALYGFGRPIAPVGTRDWAMILAPVLVMPVIAYIFSLGAERQTGLVRRLLDRLAPGKSAPARPRLRSVG